MQIMDHSPLIKLGEREVAVSSRLLAQQCLFGHHIFGWIATIALLPSLRRID
jgi:hypothetical protein